MQDEITNKASIIFSIVKGKTQELSYPKEIDKSKTCKFYLLKKKRILNKKLSLSEIMKSGYKIGRWENEEHHKFIQSCMTYKNNWRKIQQDVMTRTPAQIRSHAQKYVIKLCKKYSIKMKNQKDSQGEDNNFRIGIMPNSRVRRTLANEEDLKFLMCFDYYKNNLIIEDDNESGMYNDEKEIADSSNNEACGEKKKISPYKKSILSKTKFPKKINNDNSNKINNLNKKEFFRIEKKDEEDSLNEFQKELLSIVNDNKQFMNIYIKNDEIKENVYSIFEFLHRKQYPNEVGSIVSLFDVPNFMQIMETTLKMWSMLDTDIVNL